MTAPPTLPPPGGRRSRSLVWLNAIRGERHREAIIQDRGVGDLQQQFHPGLLSLSLPSRPVDWDHPDANQRHPDFRFDVRQEVGNPPWRVGVSIDERWIAGRIVAV
jgi:hypothetical protein